MNIAEKCVDPYMTPKGIIYPCGQCEHCRRTKGLEWVIRANHELLTEKNGVMFITLTYSPKNLRVRAKKKQVKGDCRGTLVKRDEQLFKKRFRNFWEKTLGQKNKLRFILAGEYGTLRYRPHYHAIIFGADINILQKYIIDNYEKINSYKKWNGDKDLIDTLFGHIWNLGHVDVDRKQIHEHALQYVIGYIRKKIGNRFGGKEIYEDNGRIRPYLVTSQGIGRDWCDKNLESWTQTLKVGWLGKQVSIPRYYLKRVYQKEGTQIKYTLNNLLHDEKITFYKVIKNPSGKYTNRILKTRLENQKKTETLFAEKNPLLKEEIKEYHRKINEQTANFILKDLRLLEKWNKNEVETTIELQKKYDDYINKEIEIAKKGGRKKRKRFARVIREQIEKKDLLGHKRTNKDTYYLSAIKKAKRHEEDLKSRNVYGKREKYEIMEIIENGEHTEPEKLYFTPLFDWELKTNMKKFKKTLDKLKLEFYNNRENNTLPKELDIRGKTWKKSS